MFSRHKLTQVQKGLIYEIVSGVVRWKGYLDWALSGHVQKTIKNDIKYLLWVGLYQISFMKKAKYHVVNESVEYAKREHGAYVANFVNAVLRRFIREKDDVSRKPLPDMDLTRNSQGPITPKAGQLVRINTAKGWKTRNSKLETRNLSIAYSFPPWLVERWLRRFGHDETEKLLTTLNKPPEFGIRVSLNLISRNEVIRRLEEKGIRTKKGQYLESALYVDKLSQVLKDELFRNGLIHVQDEASQLAGWSVGPASSGFVLDACAGLGTKTEQLKEQLPGATVIAMDNEIKRLALIPDRRNLVTGDAGNSPFKNTIFSAILLDAPCSSLGIIRKHPEIKWRRKEKDIAGFGRYQLNLIKCLWKKLKPGGHMVYSVCSFEPEETVSVIEQFKKEEMFILENPLPFLFNKRYMSKHDINGNENNPPQFPPLYLSRSDSVRGKGGKGGFSDKAYFLSLPHETGMDGFFIARLKKI